MGPATVINRILGPFDVVVSRRRTPRATVESALSIASRMGAGPQTVIDVGAAYGDWSKNASQVFPCAEYLLVEPLVEFAPFLEDLARELQQAVVIESALGQSVRKQTLHVHDDLVGTSLKDEPHVQAIDRKVAVTTIDELVRDLDAKAPYLIKLDVQGAELDVLSGATDTLPHTELVLLEALFFPFYEEAGDFGDIVTLMLSKGFVVFDIFDLGYRPIDGALAQADVAFVPRQSELRRESAFATPAQRRALDANFKTRFAKRKAALREPE
jgi:FkbM family methyltransferase